MVLSEIRTLDPSVRASKVHATVIGIYTSTYINHPLSKSTNINVRVAVSFSLVSWGGVRLSPLGTSATNWPIVRGPDDR
jgi:hypothetical protein